MIISCYAPPHRCRLDLPPLSDKEERCLSLRFLRSSYPTPYPPCRAESGKNMVGIPSNEAMAVVALAHTALRTQGTCIIRYPRCRWRS